MRKKLTIGLLFASFLLFGCSDPVTDRYTITAEEYEAMNLKMGQSNYSTKFETNNSEGLKQHGIMKVDLKNDYKYDRAWDENNNETYFLISMMGSSKTYAYYFYHDAETNSWSVDKVPSTHIQSGNPYAFGFEYENMIYNEEGMYYSYEYEEAGSSYKLWFKNGEIIHIYAYHFEGYSADTGIKLWHDEEQYIYDVGSSVIEPPIDIKLV